MALIFWEQIRNTLPENGYTLTGSLSITGSLLLNDVDLDEIVEYSIFRPTGSFYNTTNNIGITGSLQLTFDGVEDYFSIVVAEQEVLRVNEQGTLQFLPQTELPNAVSGGFYYGLDNEFYLGFKL
jgi:hypothetical protein